MLRRLLKRNILAVAVLMLLAGGSAWAQCQPSNQPTLGISGTQIVDPSQVPFAAVTVNVSDTNGSNPSHKLTIGLGTTFLINYVSRNASAVNFYWSLGDNTRHSWFSVAPNTSGAITYGTSPNWTSGVFRIYAVASEKSGSGSFSPTTQDVVSITTTSQGPGIYSNDGIASNAYLAVTGSYSGVPNIDTNACPTAYQKPITPTGHLQLANATSGEQRNMVSMSGATTTVGEGIQANPYDYISFLPGDDMTANVGGITYCSAIGNIFPAQVQNYIEWAWTKVSTIQNTCQNINNGVRCNVTSQYMCSPASQPPDLGISQIYTKLVENPVLMPPFWWGWGLGWRPFAPGPWIFPANVIVGVTGSDYWVLKVLTGAFPATSAIRDCTNKDKHLIPEPWPPFDMASQ